MNMQFPYALRVKEGGLTNYGKRRPAKGPIMVTRASIEVSENAHAPKGYYANLRWAGRLPGCKRDETFTTTPTQGAISVGYLFHDTQHWYVEPAEFVRFVALLPVYPTVYAEQLLDLTPEMIADARATIIAHATCPAVCAGAAEGILIDLQVALDEIARAEQRERDAAKTRAEQQAQNDRAFGELAQEAARMIEAARAGTAPDPIPALSNPQWVRVADALSAYSRAFDETHRISIYDSRTSPASREKFEVLRTAAAHVAAELTTLLDECPPSAE